MHALTPSNPEHWGGRGRIPASTPTRDVVVAVVVCIGINLALRVRGRDGPLDKGYVVCG